MAEKVKKPICILIIIAGLLTFFYPDLKSFILDCGTESYIQEFRTEYPTASQSDSNLDSQSLYREAEAYNLQIFQDGQAGFRDAWSVTQEPVSLDGLDSGRFGYIEIPSMGETLPLYIGASAENLAKGAAVLGGTSLPIGGDNTNSVIAAHRGYRGVPFFRNIEEVTVGDPVYITNPWETLVYRVESIDIIEPTDIDAVKIQEGRDMITLMTCHPYRSDSKYRYIVYCAREGSMVDIELPGENQDGYIIASDGTDYELSGQDIKKENMIRRCCGVLIIGIVVITMLRKKSGNSKERRDP